jgi:hypothetical protein
LNGVEANENYLFGAYLEGAEVYVGDPEGFGGPNSFSSNGSGSKSDPKGYGLKVVSASLVMLTNVTANENQLFGADVEATGVVAVVNSFFNGNKSYTYSYCKGKTYYGYGLRVVTNDAVVLDSVTASGNYLFGASLKGAATPISNSVFSDNGSGSSEKLTGKGLEIVSSDIVTLDNVTANNNQLFGADIQAAGDVTVRDSFFSGHKVYTYSCQGKKSVAGGGYGLRITSDGTVTLDTVEALNNYFYGAYLKGAAVDVAESNFSNNGSESESKPVGKGLEIVSSGKATLDGVTANNNQFFGADVQAAGDVTVANSFFNGNNA